MLFFGHIGLTTGLVLLIDSASGKFKPVKDLPSSTQEDSSSPGTTSILSAKHPLLNFFDMRIIMIGSLLPDIIDKPIGNLFFRDYFYSNGRIFSHTLLFLLMISLSGFILYKLKKQTWGLALAVGALTHLIFDTMWNTPQTLFWPFLGTKFPEGQVISFPVWLEGLWNELFVRPYVSLPEVAGFLVLLVLAIYLIRENKLKTFLKTGSVI